MTTKVVAERPACGDCRHWDQIDEHGGTCHFGPPQTNGMWPFTRNNDWCGQWKAKPPPPKAKAAPE